MAVNASEPFLVQADRAVLTEARRGAEELVVLTQVDFDALVAMADRYERQVRRVQGVLDIHKSVFPEGTTVPRADVEEALDV